MEKQYCFIGGAPKCGTSTIFDVLAQHEGVTPSVPKETFYFLKKENPLLNPTINFHTNGLEGFDNYFNGNTNNKLLEGTTHLLYQTEMIEVIKKMDAKVLFVLRAPEERIKSSFNYTKHNLGRIKQGLFFDQYIQLLLQYEEHKIAHWVSNENSLFVLKRELNYSAYINYLERWMLALKANVKVVFYEDMIADKPRFYRDICSFLKIAFDEKFLDGSSKNVTRAVRNKSIHYFLSTMRDNGLFKAPIFSPIKNIYNKLQSKSMKKEDDQDVLDLLREYYKPYNKRLVNLIGHQVPW